MKKIEEKKYDAENSIIQKFSEFKMKQAEKNAQSYKAN